MEIFDLEVGKQGSLKTLKRRWGSIRLKDGSIILWEKSIIGWLLWQPQHLWFWLTRQIRKKSK
jgi:hypothetical protein